MVVLFHQMFSPLGKLSWFKGDVCVCVLGSQTPEFFYLGFDIFNSFPFFGGENPPTLEEQSRSKISRISEEREKKRNLLSRRMVGNLLINRLIIGPSVCLSASSCPLSFRTSPSCLDGLEARSSSSVPVDFKLCLFSRKFVRNAAAPSRPQVESRSLNF